MSDITERTKHPTSFRLEKPLLAKLRAQAEREGRSVSNMLVRILEEGLKSRERASRKESA